MPSLNTYKKILISFINFFCNTPHFYQDLFNNDSCKGTVNLISCTERKNTFCEIWTDNNQTECKINNVDLYFSDSNTVVTS